MANKKISVSILKHCFSEIILFSVTFSVGQDLFFWRSFSGHEVLISPFCLFSVKLGYHDG